ncbi:uncharacterized protein PHALS_11557 [Plasmopara halstedii]|uniref:Uncharacterized protein n=1 Tax=Plasmopara halstedii TaxID=4781 RepID=A0A0P1AJP7_PLAHL|nr:uncharacterized protein PHALS_11557 [Plasmopara halstedii]CEG41194.1 hypothetical protein PHALS_11557 [Plasmopara halstedii]|eukprot:XP_024577563.1 hypothetical protein PHALS_11557 [Plasmopara halstedii]
MKKVEQKIQRRSVLGVPEISATSGDLIFESTTRNVMVRYEVDSVTNGLTLIYTEAAMLTSTLYPTAKRFPV